MIIINILILLLTMYWFQWHCHANDALQSHNNSEDWGR